MNELQIFNNPEFGEIRTISENGAVLFCGSDVARALGYSNTRDALAKHCKGVAKRDTPTGGGEQSLAFIPESDLYRLIFRSKLPSAERFTDWVTTEVLPSIRKNGGYFYSALSGPDYETLRKMEKKGHVVSGEPGEKGIYFWMTREGLDWLGEKLRIQIHDPRD